MEENWRKLDHDERLQWGDEVWCECGHWLKGYAYETGRPAGGLIVRRAVLLMNRNPTDEELRSHTTPDGREYPLRIPGEAGNSCIHSKDQRINPDLRLVELPRGPCFR